MWWLGAVALAGGDLVAVDAGAYAPLYPPDPAVAMTRVAAFRLDRTPVTRGGFREFVAANPQWRRDRVKSLFADDAYLADWPDALDPGPDGARRPVTRVSWFAARAYCEARGARLPTEDEWEYVARASETAFDASDDPQWLARTLDWYARPGDEVLPDVGAGAPNAWGVHDMHGLVWEWVEDYNNTVFGTDARDSGDDEALRFCGSGALSATDARDYASFMRIAFRSSLQARYTTAALGFRCAMDEEAP